MAKSKSSKRKKGKVGVQKRVANKLKLGSYTSKGMIQPVYYPTGWNTKTYFLNSTLSGPIPFSDQVPKIIDVIDVPAGNGQGKRDGPIIQRLSSVFRMYFTQNMDYNSFGNVWGSPTILYAIIWDKYPNKIKPVVGDLFQNSDMNYGINPLSGERFTILKEGSIDLNPPLVPPTWVPGQQTLSAYGHKTVKIKYSARALTQFISDGGTYTAISTGQVWFCYQLKSSLMSSNANLYSELFHTCLYKDVK